MTTKFTITAAYDTAEEAIEALARLRGTGRENVVLPAASTKDAKETAPPKSPKASKGADSPPTAATSAPAASSAPAQAETPASAPAPAPTPPAAPAPDLRTLADLVGRGVDENRTGTVAVLATFGAKKASQIPTEKLAEAIAAMDALLAGGGGGDDLTS